MLNTVFTMHGTLRAGEVCMVMDRVGRSLIKLGYAMEDKSLDGGIEKKDAADSAKKKINSKVQGRTQRQRRKSH